MEEVAAERSERPFVRPTRAEIDLERIVQNVREIAGMVGPRVGIYAVIKADAYGHGALPVARALAARGGVAALAVSLVEEGLELRAAGVPGPILVMGAAWDGAHREALAADLTPVVSDVADLEPFARAAAARPGRVGVHLKIDTGMSRLGVRPEKLLDFLETLDRWPAVEIVGLMTHLSSADAPPGEEQATLDQLAAFERARAVLWSRGIEPRVIHAANSAATWRFEAARYQAVRPGLAIYQKAMRLVSAVAQLRDVEPGDPASYGRLWRAPGRARVATLPVGYADGYPRRLTGRGEVLVGGRRCPVVGAVCMDMTLVDVTALEGDVRVGDEAVLLGGQGGEFIHAAELAERAGLIEYEITCGISRRVPRVYLGEAP